MKFLFVLAAVFGLANCASQCSSPHPNLYDEFKKFADMIPYQNITQIALNYIANDEQVQQVLEYLQSKDFSAVVSTVNSQKEMIDMYAFMCKNGVEIYKYLNSINDFFGLPHVTPAPSSRSEMTPSTRTFRKFLDDIEALLPLDKLQALFKSEQNTSTVWKEFVDKVSSKEFRAMVDKLIAMPEVKKFSANLQKLGANIEWLEDFVRKLLGWTTTY